MDAGEKNTTRASIGALVLGGLISLLCVSRTLSVVSLM